jgi:hypothetical protein
MKKIFNEGNQVHNFISSSGSDFLTSYGSGSTGPKVTVPTVPVPQRCLAEGTEGEQRLHVVAHTAVRGTLLLHPPAHQQTRHKCQAGAGLAHFNAGSIRHLKT